MRRPLDSILLWPWELDQCFSPCRKAPYSKKKLLINSHIRSIVRTSGRSGKNYLISRQNRKLPSKREWCDCRPSPIKELSTAKSIFGFASIKRLIWSHYNPVVGYRGLRGTPLLERRIPRWEDALIHASNQPPNTTSFIWISSSGQEKCFSFSLRTKYWQTDFMMQVKFRSRLKV